MQTEGPIRVAYLGPSKGGKTLLLASIIDSLSLELHGYQTTMMPMISRKNEAISDTDADNHKSKGEVLREKYEKILARNRPLPGVDKERNHSGGSASIDATLSTNKLTGFLKYVKDNNSIKQEFHVFDAPGELVFKTNEGETVVDESFVERENEVFELIYNADCVVFCLSFSQVSNSLIVHKLISNLILISDHHRSRLKPEPMRVVIALTRYDSLFLKLSPFGFMLASEPEVAKRAVRKALMPHRAMYRELRKLDAQCSAAGILDIRFVPTSAFGFLPRFACPNINPDGGDDMEIKQGKSPNLFLDRDEERTIFPFLTADPFIFAITGLENDFFVSVPDALDISALRPAADTSAEIRIDDELLFERDRQNRGPDEKPRESPTMKTGDGTSGEVEDDGTKTPPTGTTSEPFAGRLKGEALRILKTAGDLVRESTR